ncbi:MAG: hypothetical protein Q4D02_00660 [Clostridia bacterium]|nr:hypothetical protein [Clostridia bacterium]
MIMKKIDDFEWVELCRYKVNSYSNRYNNEYCYTLKNNNIEYLGQLDFYFAGNMENLFNCSIFVKREDYEKGMKLIEKNKN